jgi:hypothetical protein
MQKVVLLVPHILLICFLSTKGTFAADKTSSLLTDNYGILTKSDVESSNRDRIKPVPNYENAQGTGYRYWQCFSRKEVSLKCRSWESDEAGHFIGDADIRVSTGREIHEYGFRRAWDLSLCENHLKIWKQLAQGQDAICLLGEPAGIERRNKEGKSTLVKGWVWDRLKTKKGCDSYFGDECR